MASDLAKQANEAFVDDDYALAVDLYSQAIELDPKNAHLFADRAQANIKLEKFTEAVADASKAIALDPEMAKAYLRKGIACIKLEEYQTAKAALEKGAPLADGDSRFLRLIKDCDRHIEEETEDFDKLHVTNGSTNSVPTAEATSESENKPEHIDDTSSQTAVLPKPKFRHDFYNSQNAVVVTIFAKGIPANNVIVDFGEQILSVTVEIPGEEAYVLQPRLFAKIIPDKCKYLVLSTKIEIHLAKAEPIAWTSLEFSKEKSLPQRVAAPIDSKPAYPYSKTKVDWDKLESQVKKEEKEEKLDGDAALNKFFREIYQDADEDMRRAMSKSFVESNGTVLSTNWKEVGVKKVEGSPPDGMELKKWEY